MADKRILGNIALPDLARLIYNLDSEGPGIKIVNKDDHRFFEVLHDSETIVLNSEGKLSLPIDNVTIYVSSEGVLKAAGLDVKPGRAVKLTDSEEAGLTVKYVNVVTDSETVLINSENELYIPLDYETIVINSENKIALPIDRKTIFIDSESGLLKAAGLTVSEGEAIKITTSEVDGVEQAIIDVRYDDETIVLDSENQLTLPLDRRTIIINSEDKIAVPIDEITIIVNSEGKLEVSLEDGEAIEVVKDSEGKAHVNVRRDEHTIFLNDSENLLELHLNELKALEVDSEDKLAVKVDGDTVRFNSEGELEAKTILEGIANHIYDSEGNLKIDVLFDELKGLAVDSENRLFIKLDEEKAIDFDSEGKIFVKADEKSVFYNSEGQLEIKVDEERALEITSEGKVAVKVDGLTIKFNSEGKLVGYPEPLHDGVATHVVYGTSEWDSEAINVLFNEEAGLMVNSENELEVKIVEPLHFDSEGKVELKIDDTLKIENGELGVDLDRETLVLNSEGKIIVPIDKRTLVMENGQMIVPIDDDTIRVSSEGKLEADSLPKPLLPETFLHVNSELVVEWRQQRLNDQEFIGDLNTETAKIIWYGTSEEYARLVANSELYDYTLYVVNDAAPIVAQDFDYNKLENKPEINGVALSGNKSLADFGIQPVLNSGIAVNINNNKTDLQYLPGVLGVDSSNRLYANTYTAEQIDNMLASLRTIKYAATKPATSVRNTLYYIGTSAPYEMYLYDSYGAEIYLGTSDVRTYSAGEGININSSNVISADLDTLIQQGSTSTKAPTSAAVAAYAEAKDNKVTSISAASTNEEYPSAKLLYDQLATKIGSVAPSDNSLEVLGGTTITHKAPTDLGGAGTIGSATVIPKITYDRFGHIQKAEGISVYPPTTAGLPGQLWVSDGVEAGTWAALSSLVRIKYQTGSQANVTDSTTIVVSAPAADTGYARIGCVGAYISSTVPGVNWAVTNMSDSQVTLYANGWTGTQTITANTVWLYVRSNG